MRLIDPYLEWKKYKRVVLEYGGEYSFLESLMLHGIGSPKMDYISSGIPEFEEIHQLEKLERSATNIELLKGGLIIRINKRQRLGVAIEDFNSLERIVLKGRPVMVEGRELMEGELHIHFVNQEAIVLRVSVQIFASVGKYFNKKPFAKYFACESL